MKVDDLKEKIAAEDLTPKVNTAFRKLTKQYKEIDEDVFENNKELVYQVAFMGTTLKHLASDIQKNGVKEIYLNGSNQYGYKDRIEVKTYNNLFRNYQIAIKTLNDIFGKKINVQEGDIFDEFNK